MFFKRSMVLLLCLMTISFSAQAAPLTSFDEWNASFDLGAWKSDTKLSDMSSTAYETPKYGGKYNFAGGITWGLGGKWGLQYKYYGISTDDVTINTDIANIKGSTNELNLIYSLDNNIALFAGANRVNSKYNLGSAAYEGTRNLFQGGFIAKMPLGDKLDLFGTAGFGNHNLFQAEAGLALDLGDEWQANVSYRWFKVKDAFAAPMLGTLKSDGIQFGFTCFLDKVKKPAPAPQPVEKPVVQPVVEKPVEKPVVQPVVQPVEKPAKVILKGVNFDFDKDTLQSQSYPVLNNVVDIAKKYPDWKFLLIGHTDNMGSDEYNMDLSQRRVETVKNYLISQGVAADRLSISARGEREPIASNDTEAGRAENRRVEMVIQ